jgi:hypothetical protein
MNQLAAEALVARFRSDPNRTFSGEEIAVLEAAATDNLWAAKAVGLHHFRAQAYDRGLSFARAVAEREPISENIKNVAIMLRMVGQPAEAVTWLNDHAQQMDAIVYHDMLCSLFNYLGQLPEAIRHGDKALHLKDASAAKGAPAATATPRLSRFDPEQRARNVIAFSIWGTDPRYLNGAMTNAIVARYLYPGWQARFYVDRSVPERFIRSLTQNGAHIVLVEDLPASEYGLFWRFLVEDDPEVSLYLVRDADSVMNVKERWAVADWLSSHQAFHVMRDNPQHSELVLAGLWGAHAGNIGGMRTRFLEFVQAAGKVGNNLTVDQLFLRETIWPIMRNSVLAHDAYFNFMSPRRFNPDFALPKSIHIGQNDWVHFQRKRG